MKSIGQIVYVLGLWAVAAGGVEAQQRIPADTTRPKNEKPFNPADTVAAAVTSKRITPGRAFVRSLLIPGWGQFSTGATVRGSIYASLQGASAVMLAKTQIKISDARHEVTTLRKIASDSLILFAQVHKDTAAIRRLANPDSLAAAAGRTFAVVDKESLVKARIRQREDWITYFLFFTLASGVDAFVGAHLSDFPGTVSAEPIPAGGMRLRFEFPFGGRAPARAQPVHAPHLR